MIVILWIFVGLGAVLCFYNIRTHIANVWNNEMCDIALQEKGPSIWYQNWDIIDAILNPRHFNKWTTAQWVAYQKKIVKE